MAKPQFVAMKPLRIMFLSCRSLISHSELFVYLAICIVGGNVFASDTVGEAIYIDVYNVTPQKGQLLVGLCKQKDFLTENCTLSTVHLVFTNPQTVKLVGAPPGVYAVQIVYDKNRNSKMDTGAFGAPVEPIGFSREAIGNRGAPKFHDASFRYEGGVLSLKIKVY